MPSRCAGSSRLTPTAPCAYSGAGGSSPGDDRLRNTSPPCAARPSRCVSIRLLQLEHKRLILDRLEFGRTVLEPRMCDADDELFVFELVDRLGCLAGSVARAFRNLQIDRGV